MSVDVSGRSDRRRTGSTMTEPHVDRAPARRDADRFVGRSRERRRLDDLLQGLRERRSETLVIEGLPGIGKTALLEYAMARATDLCVAHAVGVETETVLPFTTLAALLGQFADRFDDLPAPRARRPVGRVGPDRHRPGRSTHGRDRHAELPVARGRGATVAGRRRRRPMGRPVVRGGAPVRVRPPGARGCRRADRAARGRARALRGSRPGHAPRRRARARRRPAAPRPAAPHPTWRRGSWPPPAGTRSRSSSWAGC